MKHALEKLWKSINWISARPPDVRRGEGAEARQEAKRAAHRSDPTRGTHAREIERADKRIARAAIKVRRRRSWWAP